MGNHPTKQHGKSKINKKNVHWKTAEPPFPPGKPQLVPGSPTTSPDVVTISWTHPTSDGGSPITGYLVEHRRTGSPHWVRATLNLVLKNELSLSGLEPGWRYQFRVIAENYLGKSEPSELSDPLTVTLQRTGISPPRFTIELQDTVALENEKVEFRVHVIGEPPPQVSWFKDGFEVFSSRRTKIITENDSSILIIHQSALTDEGEIKCTATNRAGYAIARANLTIEALPKIRLPRQYEDGLIIEAEEVIRLKVSIAGRPVPAIIWSHNGEIINDNYRYELENTEKYTALKISNSQRSDRGEYNLRAINKLGEDNASFLVTITSRPRPPGKVAIKMSLGKTVTLSWSPPDDDGGCKIGNYIVEYFRIGWNVWLKAATCRQLSTILNDLIEGSEYKFRVKAENPYGLSDPGEESDVLFIPDPKRGIMKPKKDEEDLKETEKPPLLPRKKTTTTGNSSPSQLSVNDDIRRITPEKSPDSRARQQKLTFNIKFTPELFDTNALEREMSYGSPQAFERFTELPSYDIQTAQEPAETASKPTAVTFKNDLPKSKQLSVHKKSSSHEAIHSSSEFMLVLYPDKEKKNSSSNDRYELDLDDMMPPPPLSLSAPELNMAPPPEPILRAAVSSTELLYERAMARFYQAVALEESENVRKRSFSVEADRARRQSIGVDQSSHLDPPLTPRLRQNSLGDTDRRSTLRRRLSGEYGPPVMKNVLFKQNSKETDEHSDVEVRPQLVREPEPIATISEELFEKTPSPPPKTREENISDDYTDSTASSIESMNQKFIEIETRHARFSDDHEEMDTYHPPRVTLSPPPTYSQADTTQAAEILTKKYQLPDPNFVPKPILKRPSKDDTLMSKSERNGLLHIFDRNKSPTPSPTPSLNNIEPPRVETPELPQIVAEVNQIITRPVVITPKKVDNKNKIVSREHSLEENHAMADFYAEIVQEVAVKRVIKRKVPLYLNSEEMKKAEEKLEMEESTESLQRTSPINMYRPSDNQPESVGMKKEQLNVIEALKTVALKEKPKEPRVVTEEEFLARLKSKNTTAMPAVTPTVAPKPEKEVTIEAAAAPERGRPTGPVARKPGQSTSRTRSQSGVRTRNGSVVRTKTPTTEPVPDAPPRPTRTVSKTRNRSESKSPSAMKRRQLQPSAAQPRVYAPRMQVAERVVLDVDLRPTTPEEIKEAADIKVKSTISYATDFSLFILACYLYIFKDARLAIPILFLMVYRQIGEAVKDKIPSWMKRKKS